MAGIDRWLHYTVTTIDRFHYICFVDLRKAYDTVNREALGPSSSHLTGSLPNCESIWKGIKGVHCVQGSAATLCLAPTLFNLNFNAVIYMSLDSHWMQNRGIRMTYLLDAQLVGNCGELQLETLVTDLEYADDMTLLADSWDALEAMLTSSSTHCQDFDLSISCARTKTMAVLPSDSFPQPEPIHLSPQPTPGCVRQQLPVPRKHCRGQLWSRSVGKLQNLQSITGLCQPQPHPMVTKEDQDLYQAAHLSF